MYPYNCQTAQQNTPIMAKERKQTKTRTVPPLSEDRRLQELLLLARKEAALLEQKYASLLEDASLREAHDIIAAMETDGKKHQRILREILFIIFSDAAEDILEELTETEIEEKDTEELLEELLLTELDDINFYRSLLSSMEDNDLWHLLFEILTDKQSHTAALNHLYAKYFVKTTGQ